MGLEEAAEGGKGVLAHLQVVFLQHLPHKGGQVAVVQPNAKLVFKGPGGGELRHPGGTSGGRGTGGSGLLLLWLLLLLLWLLWLRRLLWLQLLWGSRHA